LNLGKIIIIYILPTKYNNYNRMKLRDILQRATEFGTLSSRDNLFSFTLKILLYIFPAIILGNYTDTIIQKLQEDKAFGTNKLYYIMIQTLIVIITQYLFLIFLTDFMSEFQVTIAGGYFIVLYYGMQTNYINMIKEYIN
jgi:undecaprenyl pyrophosphate phosphatase UppP